MSASSKRLLLYGGLSLLILAPLLKPGYVFALDMVFSPAPMAADFWGRPSFLLYVLLDALKLALPTDIVQKLLLFTIFIAAGWGAERLIRLVLAEKARWEYIALGVVAYLCNPFVYGRFMTGQFSVLLGYALLPFFVAALLRFLQMPSWRHITLVVMWTVLISIVSIHTLGFLVIIGLPFLVLAVYRHRSSVWDIAKKVTAGLLVFILFSSYWIFPTLFGQGNVSAILQTIGTGDIAAFATHSQGLGVIGNVVTLQGFWADAANLYLTPADRFTWWLLPIIAMFILVLCGVYACFKLHRGFTITLLVIWVVTVILATGFMQSWLSAHVAFFAGYREPQKFLAILAMLYSLWAALGGWQLHQWLRHSKLSLSVRDALIVGLLLIPITTAPLLPWAGAGQLRASDYPPDWYSLRDYFRQQKADTKVLALPWHLYMRFDFAGRVIANPLPAFLEKPVVSSANPELRKDPHWQSQDVIQRRIIQALAAGASSTFAQQMRELGITHVVVAKTFDYRSYDYLRQTIGLQLVHESKNLLIYSVNPGTL